MKYRETADVGLDSSVGRAPARQSGGRRFKSRSRLKLRHRLNGLLKVCSDCDDTVSLSKIAMFDKNIFFSEIAVKIAKNTSDTSFK